jgi:hypothetical protein
MSTIEMSSFGTEKGVSIRMPSTANLMVSSYDKTGGLGTTAGNFGIAQNQSLMNGFFTRIAATELAMNWNVFNVSSGLGNDQIVVDISGVGNQTFFLGDGTYTIADILDSFILLFNAQSGGSRTMAVTSTGQIVTLAITNGFFRFPAAGNDLIVRLGFPVGGAYALTKTTSTSATIGLAPSEQVQPILYLDFVSSQLTYNQDLKDGSTDNYNRDVLLRFYMNFDNDMVQVDKYGFAIRMGMKPFYIRRTFNPPKQIRWDPNAPLGQLSFQVYAAYADGTATSLLEDNQYNWLMTLQVSEV